MRDSRPTTPPIAALALPLLLGAVALAYWPGLAGGFLFDDLINLDALGRYGGVRDLETFLYFLTSGTADPTGRPVAQATFLLDATDWPADPWPFKRTNLALQLANGALLFLLLRRLAHWLPGASRTGDRMVALLATALWVAHPLWVSTTLYVIQRQAMLAGTFALLGLLAWDCAYRCLLEDRTRRAWTWIVAGVGGATVLAGLSKANGFLLPLLALVVWFVLQAPATPVQRDAGSRRLRGHVAVALGMPSLILLAYLAYQVPAAIRSTDAFRDFTLAERVLSQPRVLWDYLARLSAPRSGTDGVFTDAFAASHGLLDPWTTLPALAGLAGLAVLAIAARARWPRLSVALLFFLAGHLLESGPVPLELSFEHRNYLPAMLLGWPLAYALLAPGPARRPRLLLALLLPVLWLGLTWQRATVWGDPALQAALWAERNQESPRAQGHAANWLLRQGRHEEARALLARSNGTSRPDPMIALNRIAEGCASGHIDEAARREAERATATLDSWNQGTVDWYERMQRAVLRGDCPALGRAGWERLAHALRSNPAFVRAAARRQVLARMAGRLALADADPERALRAFDGGLEIEPRPELALAQAADLGNAGYAAWGLRHLDHYRSLGVDPAPPGIRSMPDLHRWLLARTGYYRRELEHLHRLLAAEPPRGTR